MKYRKSVSGVRIPESDTEMVICLTTKCPAKWVIIDTQDGHVYGKNADDPGWIAPSRSRLVDSRDILTKLINRRG
jgi:hypothetical protein